MSKPNKRGRGRPKGVRHNASVIVRLPLADKARWQEAAIVAGQGSLAIWIRATLNKRAKAILGVA